MNKKIILVIISVVVLAGGGYYGFTWWQNSKTEPASEATQELLKVEPVQTSPEQLKEDREKAFEKAPENSNCADLGGYQSTTSTGLTACTHGGD